MTIGELVRAAHHRHVDMWDTWARADAAREDTSIVMKPDTKDWQTISGHSVGHVPDPPMAVVEAW